MFAKKSLKENGVNSSNCALNGMELICAASLQKFIIDGKNEDLP